MLVTVLTGFLAIPVGEGRISQATCDRIQLGMTLAEVKSLLGDCYWGAGGSLWDPPMLSWYDAMDGWLNGDEIVVTFDWPDRRERSKSSSQLEVIKKEYHRTGVHYTND
jgi:hypothetical protein